jgi:hypothetical protein
MVVFVVELRFLSAVVLCSIYKTLFTSIASFGVTSYFEGPGHLFDSCIPIYFECRIASFVFYFLVIFLEKKKIAILSLIYMLKTVDILCFKGSKLTSMIEVAWPLQVVLVVRLIVEYAYTLV